MRNKWGARKTLYDGIIFDSEAESNRYKALRLMQAAGQISGLERQPNYMLQEKFRHNGKMIPAITYTADFVYYEIATGKEVVEDVKGASTEPYRIRRKLFIKRYPHLDHREIDANEYRTRKPRRRKV